MRSVSEYDTDNHALPLDEAIDKMIFVIQSTVDSLPDPELTPELQQFGEMISAFKSSLPNSLLNYNASHHETVHYTTRVNTHIHTVTSNLLKQSIHPEILSNVLFVRWLRVATFHNLIPEAYYQKMEFYFSEIIDAVRECVPSLFRR